MRRIMYATTAAFALAVTAAAGTAAAAEDPTGESDVNVRVSIPQAAEPGALALTVAAQDTTLAENGSTSTIRQFTGELPDVTVTDTRTAAEVPDDADWYVLGTASDFTSAGRDPITADHLGWSPRLVAGADDGDISVGGDVGSTVDGDRGLVDQELLYERPGTTSADAGGVWTASADLALRVPSTVAPGDYTSVITLSLFE